MNVRNLWILNKHFGVNVELHMSLCKIFQQNIFFLEEDVRDKYILQSNFNSIFFPFFVVAQCYIPSVCSTRYFPAPLQSNLPLKAFEVFYLILSQCNKILSKSWNGCVIFCKRATALCFCLKEVLLLSLR